MHVPEGFINLRAMDVLLNILEEAPAKEAQSLKSLDTHMTREVCGTHVTQRITVLRLT